MASRLAVAVVSLAVVVLTVLVVFAPAPQRIRGVDGFFSSEASESSDKLPDKIWQTISTLQGRSDLPERRLPCPECKRHRAVICGLAHNVAATLPRLVQTVEAAGRLFQDYRIVIYESGSTDGTAGMLAAWYAAQEQESGRLTLVSERKDVGGVRDREDRTQKLAAMRNRVADIVFGLGSTQEAAPTRSTTQPGRQLRQLRHHPLTLRQRLQQLVGETHSGRGRRLTSLDAAVTEALVGRSERRGGRAASVHGARRLAGFGMDVVVVADLDFEFGIDVAGIASVFRPHTADPLQGWVGRQVEAALDGEGGDASTARASLQEAIARAEGVGGAVPPAPSPQPSHSFLEPETPPGEAPQNKTTQPIVTVPRTEAVEAAWPYDWDAVTAYGQQAASGFYWDWAALRLRGLPMENHIESREDQVWYAELKRRLTSLDWLPVRCAFGGLAVFRAAALASGSWKGDRTSNGCEHVGLCRSMAAAGFRRLFIAPTMVQLYDLKHGASSWAKRLALANNASKHRPTGESAAGSSMLLLQARDRLWLRHTSGQEPLQHPSSN